MTASEQTNAEQSSEHAADSAAAAPARGGTLKKFAREWLWPLFIVAVIVAPFRSAVADWNDVPTGSMEPTILPGDRLFVNKLAYGLRVPFTRAWVTSWGDPEPGDIVILFSPVDGTRLVKRVVGLPGDRLELRNNVLVRNGTPVAYERATGSTSGRLLTETLGRVQHAIVLTPGVDAGKRWFGELTVPPDSYFVMGDNRDSSADSRYFGVVKREDIVGKATAVVMSLDPKQRYSPRWERFFTGLK